MACSLRMEAVIFRIKYNTNRGTLFIHFGRSWNTCWCCGEMPTLLQLLQSFVYLIPLLIRSTFLTRRKGRLFVEIPLTTSANSVSSTREGSAAGGRAGETVVLKKKKS